MCTFQFSNDQYNQRGEDFVAFVDSGNNYVLRPGEICEVCVKRGMQSATILVESLQANGFPALKFVETLTGRMQKIAETQRGRMRNAEPVSYLLTPGLLYKELSVRYDSKDGQLVPAMRVASFCQNTGVVNFAIGQNVRIRKSSTFVFMVRLAEILKRLFPGHQKSNYA